MRLITLILLMNLGLSIHAQDAGGVASEPIVLEWADSLVGTGPSNTGIREFVGNVRFRQGDVTVTCDRAIHHTAANRADLFGNVVVKQGSMTMRSPRSSFDGNSHIAKASQGVVVEDPPNLLTSKNASYSTETLVAKFRDSVVVVDDTMKVWADHAIYYRSTTVSIATGRVVAEDSVRSAILRGDSLYHDPRIDYLSVVGDAAVWSWDNEEMAKGDSSAVDTLYLIADAIESVHEPIESFVAVGSVELVRGSVAARADSIHHLVDDGLFSLFRDPVVWADSFQLHADTIYVVAPERQLNSLTGVNQAIMVSRSDTLRPDRFDQVSGREVHLAIDNDTLESLVAVDESRSITWRVEGDDPNGLANFTSDTIKVLFQDGTPVDIYWLGGIVGEHHPEPVVTGKVDTYKLPDFEWRSDRPSMPPPTKPFSIAPARLERVVKSGESSGGDVDTSTKKKQ